MENKTNKSPLISFWLILTRGLMERKSIALFLLRAYPSGEIGMLTLPHQIFYKKPHRKFCEISARMVCSRKTYVFSDFVKHHSLFFRSTAGLLATAH